MHLSNNKKRRYDAIVIGSGMTGGIAAKELCEKGLRTLVLERGPNARGQKCICYRWRRFAVPRLPKPQFDFYGLDGPRLRLCGAPRSMKIFTCPSVLSVFRKMSKGGLCPPVSRFRSNTNRTPWRFVPQRI